MTVFKGKKKSVNVEQFQGRVSSFHANKKNIVYPSNVDHSQGRMGIFKGQKKSNI